MTKLNGFIVHSVALLQSTQGRSLAKHDVLSIITKHGRIQSRGPMLLHVSDWTIGCIWALLQSEQAWVMLCCRTCVLSRFEQANVTHCYRACVLSMLSEHIATAHVLRTTHCFRILAVHTFPLNSCRISPLPLPKSLDPVMTTTPHPAGVSSSTFWFPMQEPST